MIQSRKGNYMAFFPSYRLMQDVYAVYEELYADENVTCLIQESAMRSRREKSFWKRLRKTTRKRWWDSVSWEAFSRRELIWTGKS